MKMHLEVSSGKLRPFSLVLNVLRSTLERICVQIPYTATTPLSQNTRTPTARFLVLCVYNTWIDMMRLFSSMLSYS